MKSLFSLLNLKEKKKSIYLVNQWFNHHLEPFLVYEVDRIIRKYLGESIQDHTDEVWWMFFRILVASKDLEQINKSLLLNKAQSKPTKYCIYIPYKNHIQKISKP